MYCDVSRNRHAAPEPHVVDRYPLVTFPKYVWAMRWHNPGMSIIIIQNSKMAAAKPEIVKVSEKSRSKTLCLRSQTRRDINEIPTALPRFQVQLSIGMDTDTV